jgi:hypothetical protein
MPRSGTDATESTQWGYFEVGMYIEGPAKRKDVLKDFTMGRLDISKLYTLRFHRIIPLSSFSRHDI